MVAQDQCEHDKGFDVNAAITGLISKPFTEPPKKWQADIRIHCKECGMAFRFIGLPMGLDLNGACVSFDGTEARMAILPVDKPIDMTGLQGFSITKG